MFVTIKVNIEGDDYLLAEIKKDKELEASLNAIVKEDLSVLAKVQKVRKLASFLKKTHKITDNQLFQAIFKKGNKAGTVMVGGKKIKIPKTIHRLDKNMPNDPKHIHIIKDGGEVAVYKGGKLKHEKGNIKLDNAEKEFLKAIGWID